MRLKSQLLSPPIIYIRVWWGIITQPGLFSSECRDERVIFMTPESSARGLGADDICSAITGTVSVVINVQKLRAARSSQAAATQVAGDWEEEQPPSREILDQQRDQAAWDWDDWNAILSYLTQHWLHFFLSWVLAEQRGKFAIFYPSQHSTDK